jgi:glycosyltransferase involved in cell wall biosynthesis
MPGPLTFPNSPDEAYVRFAACVTREPNSSHGWPHVEIAWMTHSVGPSVITIGHGLRGVAYVTDGRAMTSRQLNVLVIDQARGVWGAQRYLLRLAPLLREYGVELTLAGPRSLELHRVWREAGFEAIHLDLPIERNIRDSGRPTLSGILAEIRNVVASARLISMLVRGGGYDALWANGHWTHVEATLAGRVCRKPVVLHLHEEAVPGLGLLLRACAVLMATRAVAVSRAVAAGLPRVVRDRVRVIPNGVDTEAMSPASEQDAQQISAIRAGFGIGGDDVMVLAATRLDPTKRIEDLLAAISSLDNPHVRLIIAGTTSAYPAYECEIRAHADAMPRGQVSFCGNRNDMTDLYRACDVVIHAGIVEGMPLGLIEAQACAKPVIAYSATGVPEAVLNGTTGLLVEPLDVAQLTDALRVLADNPMLRLDMGKAARAHVLSLHEIGLQARRNLAVLNEVCASSRTIA